MKKTILKYFLSILMAIGGFAFKNPRTTMTVGSTVATSYLSCQSQYLNGALSATDTIWRIFNLNNSNLKVFETKYYNNTANNYTSIRTAIIKFDSLNSRRNDGTPTSIIWADNNGNLKRSDISSVPINSTQVNTALGANPIQSLSISGNSLYISNSNNIILPTSNSYDAGYGITKTGSAPNQTFAINQSDIMTVNRAGDSIASINSKINGKVPSSRNITINGVTQDLSADRTWSVATGLSAITASTGISITSNSIITNTAPNTTNTASGYGSGTVYNLTTTSAKVDFGTTDPQITIPAAGTYLIISNLKIEYSGLTTVGNAVCNFKLRRTNNTAADLSNANTNFNVPALTLLTATGGDADIQPIIYTTTNNNDIIEMWGNRGNNVTVGNIQVGEASIVAIRLY